MRSSREELYIHMCIMHNGLIVGAEACGKRLWGRCVRRWHTCTIPVCSSAIHRRKQGKLGIYPRLFE